MISTQFLAAAVLLLLASAPETAMSDAPPALRLDVQREGGAIAVQLIGHSPEARQVSYALEVSGRSSSRHRGKTTLAAGATAVLSTMRVEAGDDWCVKLTAEEQGRAPYEVVEGSCSASSG